MWYTFLPFVMPSVCVVSLWEAWGPCVGDCEFGLQVRNRDVIRAPFPEKTPEGRMAIRPCPALYQVMTCKPKPCGSHVFDATDAKTDFGRTGTTASQSQNGPAGRPAGPSRPKSQSGRHPIAFKPVPQQKLRGVKVENQNVQKFENIRQPEEESFWEPWWVETTVQSPTEPPLQFGTEAPPPTPHPFFPEPPPRSRRRNLQESEEEEWHPSWADDNEQTVGENDGPKPPSIAPPIGFKFSETQLQDRFVPVLVTDPNFGRNPFPNDRRGHVAFRPAIQRPVVEAHHTNNRPNIQTESNFNQPPKTPEISTTELDPDSVEFDWHYGQFDLSPDVSDDSDSLDSLSQNLPVLKIPESSVKVSESVVNAAMAPSIHESDHQLPQTTEAPTPLSTLATQRSPLRRWKPLPRMAPRDFPQRRIDTWPNLVVEPAAGAGTNNVDKSTTNVDIIATKNATEQPQSTTVIVGNSTTTGETTTWKPTTISLEGLILRSFSLAPRKPQTTPTPHDLTAPCSPAGGGNARCCRAPVRRRCPNGSAPQRVIRWMRNVNTGDCVTYNYAYCGKEIEDVEQPIKYQAQCYHECYTQAEKETSDFKSFLFHDGFKLN